MIEVIVVGEGQTEETFVRDVVAPALWSQDISLQPRLIRTSGSGRGGALRRDRVMRFLRNTLNERADMYVTTLFDLHGLDNELPGVQESSGIKDPIQRATTIEWRFAEVVVQEMQCRPDRFFPHIQPHEFESLLFSDIARLAELEPEWRTQMTWLLALRDSVASPEHINDGPTTHPSARLSTLRKPRYSKTLHGPLAAASIGLDRMRRECTHFASWLERLAGLSVL